MNLGRAVRLKKPGTAPGTAQYVGRSWEHRPELRVITYSPDALSPVERLSADEAFARRGPDRNVWIDLSGVHDVGLVTGVGSRADLHPLIVEDILNTSQRPKLEESGEQLFVVIRMLLAQGLEDLRDEQVCFVLRPNLVLSFQETPEDVFEPVRRRMEDPNSRLRQRRADYLLYALLDALVDHYFIILQGISDRIELLEEGIVEDPSTERLNELYQLRSQTITLRRSVWPLRDVAHKYSRLEHPLVDEINRPYLRDLEDHTVQVLDAVETHRELISTLIELHLSSVSQRLNEVMKVLTLVATLFIPLTFIAGIYGMNFEYMPELGWRGGYFATLGVMAAVSAGMICYFRRKRWI